MKQMKYLKVIISIAVFVAVLGFMSDSALAATTKGENLSDVYGYIASELESRPTYIEIEVKNFKTEDITKVISSEGLETYTGANGTNYDYEVFNIKSLRYTSKAVTVDGQTSYIIKLYPSYKESKKETNYVYSKVAEILDTNNSVYDLSEAEKFAWIYNYIINNVSYDNTMTKGTAYAALTEGKTICGGYSSLYYVFADELGLNCRIAYGTGYGVYHAWNLVNLDGSWYYADSTMGDNPGYKDYFFLAAMSSVPSHNIDNGFETSFNFASVNYNAN
jgi:transglutaminase-like putative cysteine protease